MLSTIAVGTDGTQRAGQAVRFAIDLAAQYQARLVAISAYVPLHELRVRSSREQAPADVKWSVNRHQEVDEVLSSVKSAARAAGVEVTAVAGRGDAARVLIEQAARHRADVLVVGNKGIERRILGSVPGSVTRAAPCSVIVVKTA